MSRHQPLNGADSEPINAFDRTCDVCLTRIYLGTLEQRVYNDRIWFLCESCAIRRNDDADWHDSEMERAKGWVLL